MFVFCAWNFDGVCWARCESIGNENSALACELATCEDDDPDKRLCVGSPVVEPSFSLFDIRSKPSHDDPDKRLRLDCPLVEPAFSLFDIRFKPSRCMLCLTYALMRCVTAMCVENAIGNQYKCLPVFAENTAPPLGQEVSLRRAENSTHGGGMACEMIRSVATRKDRALRCGI